MVGKEEKLKKKVVLSGVPWKWQVEAGDSRVQGHPGFYIEFKARWAL